METSKVIVDQPQTIVANVMAATTIFNAVVQYLENNVYLIDATFDCSKFYTMPVEVIQCPT
jgi:hypothetical protein